MKLLILLTSLIFLNGCSSTLVNTAVTAAHTGTNLYCGSLTIEERMQFRQSYNQGSQHELMIQCSADKASAEKDATDNSAADKAETGANKND